MQVTSNMITGALEGIMAYVTACTHMRVLTNNEWCTLYRVVCLFPFQFIREKAWTNPSTWLGHTISLLSI
jgi:hypothetical protein